MSKRMSELTESELKEWQLDYPRRQELRAKIGPGLISLFKCLEELPEGARQEALQTTVTRAKKQGIIAAVIEDILIEEFIRAARANRDHRGANTDIELTTVNADSIVTPEQIEQWGNNFRIHPLIRESYLRQIRDGERRIILAHDQDGEPAGRVSLIYRGPTAQTDPARDTEELKGRPTERDVVKVLGRPSPWVEDLSVMEGYRSSGVGLRLMLEVEDIVKSSDDLPKIIGLAVRPDNSVARKMYKKLGYNYHQITGAETFVSHMEAIPPHSTLLMIKQLEAH